MKIIIHIALALTVLLCTNCWDDNKTVTYHGIINENNASKIVIIEPTDFKEFYDLLERIEAVTCNDSIPTISIKENDEEKLLGLANPCRQGVACILIKRQNVLKIKDEKIKMLDLISLDSLESYVTKHYTNNGASYSFSRSPHDALVSIIYESKDMSNLKSILNKITNSYSALNLEAPLKIWFDQEIPPPPPPLEGLTKSSNLL